MFPSQKSLDAREFYANPRKAFWSAAFWMNLQTAHDLEAARDKLSPMIAREVRPAALSAASL
jgi:plasmid maintenance system antidote protein VapI